MKIKIKQKELRSACNSLGKVVQLNNVIPITSGVLFEVKKNKAKLTATNTTTDVSCYIDADGDDVSFIAPFKELNRIVSLADGDIEFTIKDKDLKITSGDSVYKLGAMNDVVDFPMRRNAPKEKIEAGEQILNAIKIIGKGIKPNDIQPFKAAILLRSDGNKTYIVSTDGFYLTELIFDNKINVGDVMIPHYLIPVISDIKETSISFNDALISFSSEGVDIISTAMDCKFPEYKQIIPTHESKFTFDAKEFLLAIDKVTIVDEVAPEVLISFESDKAIITNANKEYNIDSRTTIAGAVHGSLMSIKFNYKYLRSLIEQIISLRPEKIIELHLGTQKHNAAKFKIVGEENFTFILMPLNKD